MNDQTIVCIFGQSLPLRSERSSRSTLVSQEFAHPCNNRWRVAVAAHSSSRAEIYENTYIRYNNTVKYRACGEHVTHTPRTRYAICTVLYCIIASDYRAHQLGQSSRLFLLCDTRVERLLCSLCNGSDCPKMHTTSDHS